MFRLSALAGFAFRASRVTGGFIITGCVFPRISSTRSGETIRQVRKSFGGEKLVRNYSITIPSISHATGRGCKRFGICFFWFVCFYFVCFFVRNALNGEAREREITIKAFEHRTALIPLNGGRFSCAPAFNFVSAPSQKV